MARNGDDSVVYQTSCVSYSDILLCKIFGLHGFVRFSVYMAYFWFWSHIPDTHSSYHGAMI